MSAPSLDDSSKTNEMTTKAQPLNFMHSFRPVYYISRIFGLMPFTIIYHSNCRLLQSKVTKFDALWLATSVVLYSLSTFLVKIYHGSVFLLLLANTFAKIGLCYCAVIIVVDMCNRWKYIEIFRKITAFDKEASNLNNHSRASSRVYYFFYNLTYPTYTDGRGWNAFEFQTKMPTQLALQHITDNCGICYHVDLHCHRCQQLHSK